VSRKSWHTPADTRSRHAVKAERAFDWVMRIRLAMIANAVVVGIAVFAFHAFTVSVVGLISLAGLWVLREAALRANDRHVDNAATSNVIHGSVLGRQNSAKADRMAVVKNRNGRR
jgi:hypothetical protein